MSRTSPGTTTTAARNNINILLLPHDTGVPVQYRTQFADRICSGADHEKMVFFPRSEPLHFMQ